LWRATIEVNYFDFAPRRARIAGKLPGGVDHLPRKTQGFCTPLWDPLRRDKMQVNSPKEVPDS
jgi:hypothetical protein